MYQYPRLPIASRWHYAVRTMLSSLPMFSNILSEQDQQCILNSWQFEVAQYSQYPNHLNNFERKFTSQNGEDGIIQEIFHRIGITNRYFIEIGSSDGQENCTRYLLETHGWQGIWVEGSQEAVDKANNQFGHLPIKVLQQFVDASNIVPLLQKENVPPDLDLLVIDLDGNDYWVWEEVATILHPRVLILEYNGSYGASESWVMPYNLKHTWPGTNLHGASLNALVSSALRHGYTLIGCDSLGVNAFFVRTTLLDNKFYAAGETLALYCAPKVSPSWFGNRPTIYSRRTPHRNYTHRFTPAEAARVHIVPAHLLPKRLRTNAIFQLPIVINNGSQVSLRSAPPLPLFLSCLWYTDSGQLIPKLSLGGQFYGTVAAGQQSWQCIRLFGPDTPGRYQLKATLLQDTNLWFSEQAPTAVVEGFIDVEK